jgi:hypothetical protein
MMLVGMQELKQKYHFEFYLKLVSPPEPPTKLNELLVISYF